MPSANLTAVQLALRAKVLTLSTLPVEQSWENVRFVPVAGLPYVEEQFVPGPQFLRGLTSGGMVEQRGMYVILWYGVAETGLGDLTAGRDALLALFPPESVITTAAGDAVRIRGDVAPYAGQIRYDTPGWAYIAINIPWRVFTLNPITN